MDPSVSLTWTATFRIAPSPDHRAKDLRGDKIILPQSALEQLLAAASTAASSDASRGSNQYASSRPQHAYYADSHQQLPNPLTFRLVNPTTGSAIYAGIREFSAPEGQILLSPYLMEALGIDGDSIPPGRDGASAGDAIDLDGAEEESSPPLLRVHAQPLERGTYVRLRPLEAGYNPDDWKALLERQLRESFTTLTNGALLSVRGVKGEMFRFLIDQFRPETQGICVVDTDLEVDIEALNEEQARETLRQIMEKSSKAPGAPGGSSIGHDINIWKPASGQVVPGDYVDYELNSWPRSRALDIELSGIPEEGMVDLLVSPRSPKQRANPRDSEHTFSVFGGARDGAKRLTIEPTNVELEQAETLLVTVYHYPTSEETNTPVPYTLRVRSRTDSRSTPNNPTQAESQGETDGPEDHPDDEKCQNCHQWVPKRTMFLHESVCRRNNTVCPQCKGVFQKTSPEWAEHWHCAHDDEYGSSRSSQTKHEEVYHTQRQCPSCPFSTNSLVDLARHRTGLCPAKLILCQFCHLEVPQEGDPFNPSAETLLSGLAEHEVACGARTTDCHLCSKIIRLRDMSAHLKHHELEKAHRTKPAVCRNANCGRTLHGVGRNGAIGSGSGPNSGNGLGLCSLCFTPLYVSLHDPEGKALRRRVERRYLTQMMQGCGKAWCLNEWCRSGRANRGLEAGAAGAAAVLPLIKPLMEAVGDAEKPMHFCVDQANQQRRRVAGLLAAEKGWELEWCIAACEAEGADADRAREWLFNWAPAASGSS